MPFLVKATLIFDAPNHGWTEVFWWTRTNLDLGLDSGVLNVIAAKRAALLGASSSIIARRVSIERNDLGVPVRGDAQLRTNPVYFGNPNQPDAAPGISLQLRYENANGARHRNSFLRGIWDSVETPDGFYNPGVAGWGTAMADYLGALVGGAGAVLGWVTRSNIAPAGAQVTGYDEETSGQVTFTCTTATFTAPQVGTRVKIRIAGLNRPNKSVLNGEWVVEVISTTQARTIVPVSAFPFEVPGTISVFDFSFTPLAGIIEKGIVFRAPGRPLLVRRGRAGKRPRG